MTRQLVILVVLTACSYDLDALRRDGGGGMDAGARDGAPPPVDAPFDGGTCVGDGECTDGNACNGVETCVSGACQRPTPVDCEDGDLCTVNTCDPMDGSCDSSPMPCGSHQHCDAGRCACDPGFDDCDGDPSSGCEADLATDDANCGGCGVGCGPGESCIGMSCGTCSSAAQCDDMLSCTTDMCTGGTCSNPFSGGGCMIAGTCYAAMQDNPANMCQTCLPGTSTSAWSDRTGPCGPVSSTDGPCTGFSDTCDTSGTLTRTTTTYTCSSGTCNLSTSTSSVACTRMTDGVACGDGVYCNGAELCSGGTCRPGAYPCGGEGCTESGCFLCGARGEQCCAGRTCDNMAANVCCGGGAGACVECCSRGDCPAGGSWQCEFNSCQECGTAGIRCCDSSAGLTNGCNSGCCCSGTCRPSGTCPGGGTC